MGRSAASAAPIVESKAVEAIANVLMIFGIRLRRDSLHAKRASTFALSFAGNTQAKAGGSFLGE